MKEAGNKINVRFAIGFWCASISCISISLYFLLTYFHTRQIVFDPFVQMPPDKFFLHPEDSAIVVLCLGGSTTKDDRLSAEDLYPTILEALLSEALFPQKVRVINGGKDWYTSKHSFINYTTYYRQAAPDIVIVMHAINDICRSFSPFEFSIGEFSADYAHYYGPSIRGAKPQSLYEFAYRRIRGDYYFQKNHSDLKESKIPIENFLSLQSYRYYLSGLLQSILGDEAQCIVLEQPSLYEQQMEEETISKLWFGRTFCNNKGKAYPDYASMKIAMDTFNIAADSICQQLGIDFLHLSSKIPKTLEYFTDDVHHTPLTTQIIAQSITELLLKKQKNPSKP
jgi:hypothetical protein